MKKLSWLVTALGVLFLALSIYFWVTPAGKLPHWFGSALGYQAGSTHIHLKHGLATFILALGCGILVWFMTGKKKAS
jgi:hypothetical protein